MLQKAQMMSEIFNERAHQGFERQLVTTQCWSRVPEVWETALSA